MSINHDEYSSINCIFIKSRQPHTIIMPKYNLAMSSSQDSDSDPHFVDFLNLDTTDPKHFLWGS